MDKRKAEDDLLLGHPVLLPPTQSSSTRIQATKDSFRLPRKSYLLRDSIRPTKKSKKEAALTSASQQQVRPLSWNNSQTTTNSAPASKEHNHILAPGDAEEEEDPNLAAFLPMLKEYLSVSNPSPPSSSSYDRRQKDEEEEDAWARARHSAFGGGTIPEVRDASKLKLIVGNGMTRNGVKTKESVLGNSVEAESDEELSSEDFDTADEDSNDEEFYRNDYPDEDSENDSDEAGDWEEDY